ncbi:MAG: aspartate aminotransferase family protein [Synergistota bacterium]|nr:aspartate aminotransferase family protein [Synergistota bacterium]
MDFGKLIPRSYKNELRKAVRGEGIYLYDEDGKEYIDGCSGALISSLGHGNEEVAKAVYDQLVNLEFAHPSRWRNDATLEAAEEVASIAPGDLKNVWFVSGGSEAIESALKIARQYFVERDGKGSGKTTFIARWNSYHGSTIGTMGLAGSMPRRRDFTPLFQETPKIQPHYCYRCPYGQTYPSCNLRCARSLENEILRLGPERVLAFVAEPVVGSTVGGLHPPVEYWPIVREICTKYDVLLIADEVMTGIGRTGKAFCVNHWDVIPDIICSAKAMASGYSPAGAILVSQKLVDVLKGGSGAFQHGHTYNANPATAAAVTATLRIMKRDGLFENAAARGEELMKGLRELMDIPIVGEVRGMGLMRGVEIVADKATKAPFPAKTKAAAVVTSCYMDHGLVVYPGTGMISGVAGDQFLVAPPLIVTSEQIGEILARLRSGLEDAVKKLNG